MEALHAEAELEHDDAVWEHIWPEGWDTMWTSAERTAGVDSVLTALFELCKVLVAPTRYFGVTRCHGHQRVGSHGIALEKHP